MTDDGLLHFQSRSMGSPLRLAVVAGRRPGEAGLAKRAWRSVRDEFDAVDRSMSRFSESSEVTTLNRLAGTGLPVAVSGRLRRALVASDRARRTTDGRFDPRVLRDLERLGDRGAPLPRPVGPSGAPSAGDWGPGGIVDLHHDGRVRLDQPVDLGGVGKGLALRWAARGLARIGVDRFLLEAGGDLVVRGAAPEGGPWLIGLEDPAGGDDPLAVLAVDEGAVTTSSVRRRRWLDAGEEVHHLIDPRTGRPGGAGLRAVTVAGPDAAWAEVWSKSLFLSGRADIAGLARRRGLAAWWVTDDGALEMTAAARQRTCWVASEAAPEAIHSALSSGRTPG